MKRVLILFVAVSSFAMVSCKKCQTCTTKVTQNVLGWEQQLSSVSEEYCGDDYDNAPEETAVTQSVAGVVQTVSITCVDD